MFHKNDVRNTINILHRLQIDNKIKIVRMYNVNNILLVYGIKSTDEYITFDIDRKSKNIIYIIPTGISKCS